MKCVILQPSYIPWRGYFDQIKRADLFVFYDDVQYDKHGWRNRNRIKTANGPIWLTIPVHKKGNVTNHTNINEIRIRHHENWASKHYKSIFMAYQKAPFFQTYEDLIKSIYSDVPELLSDFTISTTMMIAKALGIADTRFVLSSELNVTGQKTDRLVNILREVGATHYMTGPAAQNYLEEEKIKAQGIDLEYMSYDYPPYDQLYPPFEANVSVLDYLFMLGPKAADLLNHPQAINS